MVGRGLRAGGAVTRGGPGSSAQAVPASPRETKEPGRPWKIPLSTARGVFQAPTKELDCYSGQACEARADERAHDPVEFEKVLV